MTGLFEFRNSVLFEFIKSGFHGLSEFIYFTTYEKVIVSHVKRKSVNPDNGFDSNPDIRISQLFLIGIIEYNKCVAKSMTNYTCILIFGTCIFVSNKIICLFIKYKLKIYYSADPLRLSCCVTLLGVIIESRRVLSSLAMSDRKSVLESRRPLPPALL